MFGYVGVCFLLVFLIVSYCFLLCLIVSYCFLLFLPHFQCSDITRSQESHIPAYWWLTMRSCNVVLILYWLHLTTGWSAYRPDSYADKLQALEEEFLMARSGDQLNLERWKLHSQWNWMEPAIKNSQDISRQLASPGIVSQIVFVTICFLRVSLKWTQLWWFVMYPW